MSFADLKKSRNARQKPRSTIQPSSPTSASASDSASTVKEGAEEGGIEVEQDLILPSPSVSSGSNAGSSTSGDGTVPFDAALYGLPSHLSVKTSKNRGRSIYAAAPIKAGMLSAVHCRMLQHSAVFEPFTKRIPPVSDRRYNINRPELIPGTALLRTTPTVCVLSTPYLRDCCSNCGLTPAELSMLGHEPTTMKRCTNCRLARYCSAVGQPTFLSPLPATSSELSNQSETCPTDDQKCQREDWIPHKPECAAHKALRALFVREHPGVDPEEDLRWIMSESVRALGRLCWARQRGRVGSKDPDWVSGFRVRHICA